MRAWSIAPLFSLTVVLALLLAGCFTPGSVSVKPDIVVTAQREWTARPSLSVLPIMDERPGVVTNQIGLYDAPMARGKMCFVKEGFSAVITRALSDSLEKIDRKSTRLNSSH